MDLRSSPISGVEPGGAAACEEQGTPPGWARWVARISLVIALVAMGATIWAVGPATLVGHLRAIGWWFAGILALEVVITFFDARALYVLACDREQQGFGQVLFAQIAGRGVNAVTPAGALGEATKVSLLTRAMSTERAVASVQFINMTSGILQLSAVAIGAPLTALLLPLPSPFRIALIATGVIAAVIAIGLFVLVRRGMLASLVGAAVKLRIVSTKRREKWRKKLADIDERLCGTRDAHGRRMATIYIACSKVVSWCSVWITLGAAGYWAGPGMIAALVSAGVVLGWIATVVPLGLGVSETGNYALFTALGVPPAFGVALAVARRINQIFYAAIGFTLLATWRASSRAAARLRGRRTTRGGAHVRSPAPVSGAE
jgi:uncharacterized protein (TIRG00374 family)